MTLVVVGQQGEQVHYRFSLHAEGLSRAHLQNLEQPLLFHVTVEKSLDLLVGNHGLLPKIILLEVVNKLTLVFGVNVQEIDEPYDSVVHSLILSLRPPLVAAVRGLGNPHCRL